MQFDAAPLEAAFLQDVARRRVGDACACDQVLGIELVEGEIDHRACGFSAETLAPILDAEPEAEFRRVRLAPVDADHADRRKIVFDQEYGAAIVACGRANKFDRVVLAIGMRQAAAIFRNAAIVGETRDRFYVRERRPAQQQPFGLEDARTCLPQRRGRDILQHVRLLYAKTKSNSEHPQQKREAGFPPPLEPSRSAGSTGPGGLMLSTVYSAAASVIGTTDTKLRPVALARISTCP